jgi:hypothetical protein
VEHDISKSLKEKLVRLLPILVLTSLITLTGCAAANRFAQPSYKVIDSSAETRPQWLSATASEDPSHLFFVGRADGARDLSMGETQAEAQVRTVIRGELREQLRREFEASYGKSLAGKREAFDTALVSGVAELTIDGLTSVDRYWERLEVPVDDGTTYAYRMALRVRISKARFEATRAQVYQRVMTQVGF